MSSFSRGLIHLQNSVASLDKARLISPSHIIACSRNILRIENNQSILKSELVYSQWNDIAMTVVTYQ